MIIYAMMFKSVVSLVNITTELDYESAIKTAKHQSCKVIEDCFLLSQAMVYEARGEGKIGRRLVGSVILNRVDSPLFPNTVKGVIHQRRQFSYIQDMHRQRGVKKEDWEKAYQDSFYILSGKRVDKDILWYHNKSVKPIWRKSLDVAIQEGNHIFYKSITPP